MKNNTLHKQLKEFFDLWFDAEKEIISQKLEFTKMAIKNPQNIKNGSIDNYLKEIDNKLIADLLVRANKLNQKRFNIMSQFPVVRN